MCTQGYLKLSTVEISWMGVVQLLLFPKVHNQIGFAGVHRQTVSPAPCLIKVGSLLLVVNEAHNHCVVSKPVCRESRAGDWVKLFFFRSEAMRHRLNKCNKKWYRKWSQMDDILDSCIYSRVGSHMKTLCRSEGEETIIALASHTGYHPVSPQHLQWEWQWPIQSSTPCVWPQYLAASC